MAEGNWMDDIVDLSENLMPVVDKFITSPEESRNFEAKMKQLEAEKQKYQSQTQQTQAMTQTVQKSVMTIAGVGLVGLVLYLILG